MYLANVKVHLTSANLLRLRLRSRFAKVRCNDRLALVFNLIYIMQKYPKVSVLGYVVDTKGNRLTDLQHMFFANFMGFGSEINNSGGSPISETVAICLKNSGEVITVLPTHIKFEAEENARGTDKDNLSIRVLKLRRLTINSLLAAGINTVGELDLLTKSKIRMIRGIGETGVNEIKVALDEFFG